MYQQDTPDMCQCLSLPKTKYIVSSETSYELAYCYRLHFFANCCLHMNSLEKVQANDFTSNRCLLSLLTTLPPCGSVCIKAIQVRRITCAAEKPGRTNFAGSYSLLERWREGGRENRGREGGRTEGGREGGGKREGGSLQNWRALGFRV